MVKAWFESASTVSPRDLAERVDSKLKCLSYLPNDEDPEGGVHKFIINAIKALDRNNASDVLQDPNLSKRFIDLLVGKFEPPLFRERIRMRRSGWTKGQLSDIKLFKNDIGGLAVQISLMETARSRLNTGKTRSKRQSNPHSFNHQTKPKPSPNRPKRDGKAQPSNRKRKTSEWTADCLNPDCNQKHPLKDCNNTTEERRKELFEKHYRDKEQKRATVVRKSNSSELVSPNANEGRYGVKLDDTLFDVALGDYGSDFNAISAETFKNLKSLKSTISINKFSIPFKLSGAFKTEESSTFTASQSINISITIFVPGPNIPVRVRGIEFLVVDQ